MYATAHRVRAQDGREAVHAFLHAHDGVEWADDVTDWPEVNPGRLVRVESSLPLGGHRVFAYLDVLAPDGTPPARVAEAIERLREDLFERTNPTVMRVGQVTLRFGTEVSLDQERRERFAELADSVVALL